MSRKLKYYRVRFRLLGTFVCWAHLLLPYSLVNHEHIKYLRREFKQGHCLSQKFFSDYGPGWKPLFSYLLWGCAILFTWSVMGRFIFSWFNFFIRDSWLKMERSFHVHVNEFFSLNVTREWRFELDVIREPLCFAWWISGHFVVLKMYVLFSNGFD